MQMPIVVGIILAIMGLVTFSGWFYQYASGMGELVLDDRFFGYRIVAATIMSVAFMVAVFWVIALVNECPNQTREGIFGGLKCESYLNIKASANQLFKPNDQPINESLQ